MADFDIESVSSSYINADALSGCCRLIPHIRIAGWDVSTDTEEFSENTPFQQDQDME